MPVVIPLDGAAWVFRDGAWSAGTTAITGGGAVALGGFTLTVPATGTAALLATENAFTAAQTVTAANGLTTLAAATQDALRIAGRAGGTSSYIATLTVPTLAASVTHTLPAITTTLAGLAVAQTFTAAQAMSSSLTCHSSTVTDQVAGQISCQYFAIPDSALSVGGANYSRFISYYDGAKFLFISDIAGTGTARPIQFTSTSTLSLGGSNAVQLTLTGASVTLASGTLLIAANTTDATAVGTASVILSGGLGVAKRSYLGTIGATFKGNVAAGVQDATAAVAGQVGEELKSTVSAVAAAATGTVSNVTSISLTAGDWLLSGYITTAAGATGLTAATTQNLSIVTTTATNGTLGDTMQQQTVEVLTANALYAIAIPAKRVNISATTTYYLTSQVTYVAGSPTHSGTLTATRVR